ncbi:MAG: DUF5678 domain-containing protein [bacterium]
MKIISYQNLQKKYGGMFVAFPQKGKTRVVAAGKTAGALFKKLKEKNQYQKPHTFEYITPKDALCAF